MRLFGPKASLCAARRTYHTNQLCYAETQQQSGHARSQSAESEHPLSIRSLQILDRDVPHMFNSRSNSPYFNLAVEHHLLTYSNPASRVFFTYVNTPCVIIGRNQNPWVECDLAAITQGTMDGRQVELVRRRSGGGTVFHDEGNLNYTVIVPAEGFERKTHVQMVVDALVALREQQYVFRRWKEIKANERNDIVARLSNKYRKEDAEEEWFKVSGTAFKLTKGRALHHGTLLHSSPYIDSIGTFLRSPGKDYISAKGVESVRSPVTNLWQVEKARQRRDLTYTIRKALQHTWSNKYKTDSADAPRSIEVAAGQPEDLVPELKAGIQELRTEAWRWEQTPGFSFDSQDIGSDGQHMRLAFDVKNGLVQSVQASTELQTSYEQRLVGRKIQRLSASGQWRESLMDENILSENQDRLIKLVETCFPPLDRKMNTGGIGQSTEPDPKTISAVKVRQDAKLVARKREGDYIVEVETKGSNTVVDIDRRKKQPKDRRLLAEKAQHEPDIGTLSRQLISRIAKWVGQQNRSNMAKGTERFPSLYAINVFTNSTHAVNRRILKLQGAISELLAPSQAQILRRLARHDSLHAKLDESADGARDMSLDLTKILTQTLIEERKTKALPASTRVALFDDREGTDTHPKDDATPNMSPEAMSNAQRILEATLAMINEEDRRRNVRGEPWGSQDSSAERYQTAPDRS